MPLPVIPGIDLSIIQNLIDSGKLGLGFIQEFIEKATALAEMWDKLFAIPEIEEFLVKPIEADLGGPATLSDLDGFQPKGKWVTHEEITNRTTSMASCVAQEKWAEGFMFAISIISMAGGV